MDPVVIIGVAVCTTVLGLSVINYLERMRSDAIAPLVDEICDLIDTQNEITSALIARVKELERSRDAN